MPSSLLGTNTSISYLSGRTDRELNRLLCAAVVNARFRAALLRDPLQAAEEGYCGERFHLSDADRCRLQSIHATDLTDFAAQLVGLAESTPVELALVPCE